MISLKSLKLKLPNKLAKIVTFLTIASLAVVLVCYRSINKNSGEKKGANSINLPETTKTIPVKKNNSNSLQIGARVYSLYDAESGSILIKENIDKQVPIASITKLMTALIIIENHSVDEIVKIPKYATKAIGSTVNLLTDEDITVGALLNCLLINSGNDSAYALAIYHSKSQNNNLSDEDAFKEFTPLMNKYGKEIGMQQTKYLDPAGLDDNAISTARDQAILLGKLLRNDYIKKIINKPSESVSSTDGKIVHKLENSNRLVKEEMYYSGIIGGKTGFTPTAGHNLITAANRDGHTLIAIIINTFQNTNDASALEARKLLEYGFSNYNWITI